MNVLEAHNLRKSYRGKPVVRDVSLRVAGGEIAGLLGPNGAGKTTVFYMITGLIRPEQGRVHLLGQDVTRLPMHERARKGLAYLPQEASIFRRLSVRDNLKVILDTRRDLDHRQREQKLEQLLDAFHIGHIADTIGKSLSGGERRRAEIARALTTDPACILLDEPLAGVDPISVSDVKEIVMMLTGSGIGVLITDHNVRDTLEICDRVYIVNEGAVLAAGDTQTVLNDPRVRQVYLGEQFRI